MQVTEEQRQSQGVGGPVSAAPGAQTPALPAGTPSFAAAAAAASGNQPRQADSNGSLAAQGRHPCGGLSERMGLLGPKQTSWE